MIFLPCGCKFTNLKCLFSVFNFRICIKHRIIYLMYFVHLWEFTYGAIFMGFSRCPFTISTFFPLLGLIRNVWRKILPITKTHTHTLRRTFLWITHRNTDPVGGGISRVKRIFPKTSHDRKKKAKVTETHKYPLHTYHGIIFR